MRLSKGKFVAATEGIPFKVSTARGKHKFSVMAQNTESSQTRSHSYIKYFLLPSLMIIKSNSDLQIIVADQTSLEDRNR